MSLIKGIIKTAVVIKLAESLSANCPSPRTSAGSERASVGFSRPPGHTADGYSTRSLIRPAVVADAPSDRRFHTICWQEAYRGLVPGRCASTA